MHLIHPQEPLAYGDRTLVSVTRWESVQFRPAISRRRVENIPVPLPGFRTLSEAHVSDRAAAFGRRIPLRRSGRSRAGVRFHTTLRSQTDTW